MLAQWPDAREPRAERVPVHPLDSMVSLSTHATRLASSSKAQTKGGVGSGEELFRAFEQRGGDRARLGLGGAINRRGVETCGWDLPGLRLRRGSPTAAARGA
jgi:hypothetical protein